MKIIEVKPTVFPEVKIISYHKFTDERGYFTETFRESDLKKIIPNFQIRQINESHSKKGVIRGLHFQWNPFMGKLVRVISGHIVDLFLDIRKKSPTYGKIGGVELIGGSQITLGRWVWVPVGFAHGIVCLEESMIEYLCTAEYSPTSEAGISPLAKDIDWALCDNEIKKLLEPYKKNPIVSEKDRAGLTLATWSSDLRSVNFTS